MTKALRLRDAVAQIQAKQRQTRKPLAIVLAGHNGSGKSTMWREHLADHLRIPLINADRMMLSVLPEPESSGRLAPWAQAIRDEDTNWMEVAQKGVDGFVLKAMEQKVPFAFETVFSHWKPLDDGRIESKIDRIKEMQSAGYYVLLLFVGLTSIELSMLRVQSRVAQNGHAVEKSRLRRRFPRTQKAIRAAAPVADAAVFVDNSRTPSQAFTVCRVQMRSNVLFDIRTSDSAPDPILRWLRRVCPHAT